MLVQSFAQATFVWYPDVERFFIVCGMEHCQHIVGRATFLEWGIKV